MAQLIKQESTNSTYLPPLNEKDEELENQQQQQKPISQEEQIRRMQMTSDLPEISKIKIKTASPIGLKSFNQRPGLEKHNQENIPNLPSISTEEMRAANMAQAVQRLKNKVNMVNAFADPDKRVAKMYHEQLKKKQKGWLEIFIPLALAGLVGFAGYKLWNYFSHTPAVGTVTSIVIGEDVE